MSRVMNARAMNTTQLLRRRVEFHLRVGSQYIFYFSRCFMTFEMIFMVYASKILLPCCLNFDSRAVNYLKSEKGPCLRLAHN